MPDIFSNINLCFFFTDINTMYLRKIFMIYGNNQCNNEVLKNNDLLFCIF